jgi:hypothetical protein
MMGFTSCRLSQLHRILQLHIKSFTLLLRARILPVGTERMAERIAPVSVQLLQQRLPAVQPCKQYLCILAPEHSSMLHSRAAYPLHLGEIRALIFQALEDELDSFQPQRDRGEDLAFGRVREDALLDAILGEIGIKVDFGFKNELEVRFDNNA